MRFHNKVVPFLLLSSAQSKTHQLRFIEGLSQKHENKAPSLILLTMCTRLFCVAEVSSALSEV